MKNKITLEISAFSLEAAIQASLAGADRIELCSNPSEGGTTPSHALIKAACKNINIPVYPIIRPQGGSFCYSHEEFELIKEDVRLCKKAGCQGIATGILTHDDKVDEERLKEIVELAFPLKVTFIRAFDLVADPEAALLSIINAGCGRVLTSGLAEKVTEALPLIRKLQELADNRISIMPGSGIRSENMKTILEQTGVHEIHASARYLLPNKNPDIDRLGFGNKVTVDIRQIQEMSKIAKQMSPYS